MFYTTFRRPPCEVMFQKHIAIVYHSMAYDAKLSIIYYYKMTY